jgi:hypothetical protein
MSALHNANQKPNQHNKSAQPGGPGPSSLLRASAYALDPVLWVRAVLGLGPKPWQETFLRAPRGASILALTARQLGKTTTAAWAIANTMLFCANSLSVIACPAQRQSAEAVRRVREVLLKAGGKLTSDNVYGLELENGSRVLALPGSDDSIRGLTVDGWIVADEAARLPEDLIAALRPMRARRPLARLAMLSTAWSRSDPFWTAWASDDHNWIRLKATADSNSELFAPGFLEQERQANTPSIANISAFRPVARPARSLGSSMSGRRQRTCRSCRPARRLHRRRRQPYRCPIHSKTCNPTRRLR